MKGEYDALLPWPFRNKVWLGGQWERAGGNLGPGLAVNWPGDPGKSIALSVLSISPLIKQEPGFIRSSQGSLQHHNPRAKMPGPTPLGGM